MAIADGFHVDNLGNHWIGSNRETFDATTQSEAPFYVSADGTLVAKSGTFSGDLSAAGGTFSGDISGASGTFTGNLSGSSISGGSININNNFIVDSSGNLTANNATLNGYLTSGSSISGDQITGGTIEGTTINAGNLTVTGQFQFGDVNISSSDIVNRLDNGAITDAKIDSLSFNKLTGVSISASDITTGTLNAGLIDGDAVLDNLTTANAIGVQGAGQTSVFVGNIQANRLDLTTNMDADGWTSGDDFRGNGTTVNLYRNFSSKGIRIVGGGSGAYLYTFNSGGGSNLLYNPFSDERLKENITDLSYGLDEINQLRPITYDWKDDVKPFPENTELNYGLLAHELEAVMPELVDTAPDTHTVTDKEGNETVEDLGVMVDGVLVQNTKSYTERPLLYVAIKAIQELSAKNDELESRLAALEG